MSAMASYLAARDEARARMTATIDAANEAYAALIEPRQAESQRTVSAIRAHYADLIDHLSTERDSLVAAETRRLMEETMVATQAYEASKSVAHEDYDELINQAWAAVLKESERWIS